MTLNSPSVDVQRGRLLGTLTLSKDQSSLGGFQIVAAELANRHRVSILRTFLSGVATLCHFGELCPRHLASLIRGEHTKLAQGKASAVASAVSVLDEE